ncbi:hypothetical protein BGZ58_005849 [Dissophora ornata]|nr:hypothetical protein BGZ58_005849 [Dissophora ornata]
MQPPDDNFPVGKLLVKLGRRSIPEVYYIYEGLNRIGSDPWNVEAYIPRDRGFAPCHLLIETGEKEMAFVRDVLSPATPFRAKIDGLELKSGTFYELSRGRNEVHKVIKEARRAEIAQKSASATQEPHTDTADSASNDDAPTQLVPVQDQPDKLDEGENVPEEDSMPCTYTMQDPTPTLTCFGDQSSSLESNSDNSIPATLTIDKNILPKEFTKRGASPCISSSSTPTQHLSQLDALHEENDISTEDQDLHLGPQSEPYVDPDAPTQLLEPGDIQSLSFDDSISQPADSQGVLDESEPKRQLLQLTASSQKIKSEDASDRDQEMVCETQFTQQDEAQNTQPLTRSSQASPETASQELSQVYQERIPATPLELIADTTLVRSTNPDNVEASQDAEERRNSKKQAYEDEVPQTLEYKRHSIMSDASTIDIRRSLAPQADSLGGSLDSDSGSIHGESRDSQYMTDSLGARRHNDHIIRTTLSKTTRMASGEKGGSTTSSDNEQGHGDGKEDKGKSRRNRGPIACADEVDHGVSEDADDDDDDELPRRRNRRRSRPILKDSQEPVTSSQQLDETSSQVIGTTVHEAITQSSREGSPKHSIDSDPEERSPKPAKLIRTESMKTTTPSPSFEYYKKIIMAAGGSCNDNDYKEPTILVFDSTTRTWKLMCAIVRCIPIVTLQWLEKSKDKGRFVPWEGCQFQGSFMEERYGISLAESCERARMNVRNNVALFRDLSFYFVTVKGKGKSLVEQGYITRETVSQVKPMIEVCGGKVWAKRRPPQDDEVENVIIIGPDAYCATTQSFIKRNFRVMKREFIWNTILYQDPEYSTHKIELADHELADAENETVNDGDDGDHDDDEDNDGDDPDISRDSMFTLPKSTSKGKAVAAARIPRAVSRSLSTVSTTESILSRMESEESVAALQVATSYSTYLSSSSTAKTTKGGSRAALPPTRMKSTTGGSEVSQEESTSTSATKSSHVVRRKVAEGDITSKSKAALRRKPSKVKATQTDEEKETTDDDGTVHDTADSSVAVEAPATKATKSRAKHSDSASQETSERKPTRKK